MTGLVLFIAGLIAETELKSCSDKQDNKQPALESSPTFAVLAAIQIQLALLAKTDISGLTGLVYLIHGQAAIQSPAYWIFQFPEAVRFHQAANPEHATHGDNHDCRLSEPAGSNAIHDASAISNRLGHRHSQHLPRTCYDHTQTNGDESPIDPCWYRFVCLRTAGYGPERSDSLGHH